MTIVVWCTVAFYMYALLTNVFFGRRSLHVKRGTWLQMPETLQGLLERLLLAPLRM